MFCPYQVGQAFGPFWDVSNVRLARLSLVKGVSRRNKFALPRDYALAGLEGINASEACFVHVKSRFFPQRSRSYTSYKVLHNACGLKK